jgi:hypothetical protein
MTAFMITRQAGLLYIVTLTVARRGGWRAWGAASGDFERNLAALDGKKVITPRVESESRRGKDFVRITIAMSVVAGDIAEALASAWWAFGKAAAGDADGWDMASAAGEVRRGLPLAA